MAKREFSSGLRAMKFMQRAKAKEEQIAREEEQARIADDNDEHWVAPLAETSGRCSVICEGDPKPGAAIGRMSFKNYNPSIEKLHEELQARRTQASVNHHVKQEIHKVETVAEESEVQAKKKMKVEQESTTSLVSKPSLNLKQQQTPMRRQQSSLKASSSQNRYEMLQAAKGFKKPPAF